MKTAFKLFYASTGIILLGWIAKMHFMPGGDILFRTGTLGVIIALLIQTILFAKDPEVKTGNFRSLFLFNGISLAVLFLGLMMKVSHVMNTQLEKDVVLDFIGLPLVVLTTFFNFGQAGRIFIASNSMKVYFVKHIVTPWAMVLFSFVLYALYSAILARQ